MRITFGKPIPQSFRDHPLAKGLIAEADFNCSKGAVLHCKVLLFSHRGAMNRFFSKALNVRSDKRSLGICAKLVTEVTDYSKSGNTTVRMECDRRYFAVMGLVMGNLCSEIIAHECMHAGFAHAKRIKRSPFLPYAELDEELVCYPAGRLVGDITEWLHEGRYYVR